MSKTQWQIILMMKSLKQRLSLNCLTFFFFLFFHGKKEDDCSKYTTKLSPKN